MDTSFFEELVISVAEFLKSIENFFDTFAEDVMNNDMKGLIIYLYSCFPEFLRTFIIIVIVLAVVLGLYGLFHKS